MATDIWTGSGDWLVDLGNWSTGAKPTSSQNADIEGGVSLYGAGVAHSLQIGASGGMQTGASSSLTIGGYFANAAAYIGFQGHVSIAGNLFNSGNLTISSASGATSVTLGNLVNTGEIDIQGGTAQALVTVNAAPADGFSGTMVLSGNARLAYTSTGPSVVNADGSLEIDGSAASVTLAGASALNTLSANYGALYLESGATANDSGGFLSAGRTNIDSYGGAGGSQLTYGGALTVASGSLTLGNGSASSATTMTVASLVNEGSLYVEGGATAGATLNVNGVAPSTLTGAYDVTGDASIRFKSGAISAIQSSSSLTLAYGGSILSNGASALASLSSNYGFLDLEDTALATSVALRNYGNVAVDQGASGGGALQVGAAVYNYGTIIVGNAFMQDDDLMQVAQLANQGNVYIQGAVGSAFQAKLSVLGAASANLIGVVQVGGDGDLAFASGQINNVQYGSSLTLIGSSAEVTSGSISALGGLRLNYGLMEFRGDEYNGEGGAQVSTTGAFRNTGILNIDSFYDDGGTQIAFGGAISNYSVPFQNAARAAVGAPAVFSKPTGIYIGNAQLDQATTVTGTSLLNEGYLQIQGSASGDDEATLSISGAANSALTGMVGISGDAALKYGSGAIANIQIGSTLELAGSGAQVLSGAHSALASLTSNYGTLALEGNIGYLGQGGAAVGVTGAFTNFGEVQIDDEYLASGSGLTIGGAFTNDGLVELGNSASSGTASLLQAGALTNNEILQIGYTGGAATVAVNGAAVSTAQIAIGALGALTVGSGGSFTQSAGYTGVSGSLSAPTVAVRGGEIEFKTGLTSSDVIGAFSVSGTGLLKFDGAVDAARAIGFASATGELQLSDAKDFAGAISGFVGSDLIDIQGQTVTSSSYAGNTSAGVLTLHLSGGQTAKLHFTGSYANGSFLLQSDGAGGTVILRNAGQDVWTGSGDWDANAANWSQGAGPAGKAVLVGANSSLTASGVDKAGSVTVLHGGLLTAGAAATLTATGVVDNYGCIVDTAASVSFAALVNNANASVTVDASATSGNVTLSTGALSNGGNITLKGGPAPSGHKATLAVSGLAPTILTGDVSLAGEAALTFGSGSITTVADDATLEIYGSGTSIMSGSASALTTLASNYGVIEWEGNAGVDDGGVTLHMNGGLLNVGYLDIDSFADGGSQISVAGLLTNANYLYLGNSGITVASALTVGGLTNQGQLQIQGGAALTGAVAATLTVNANASTILSGSISLLGDAILKYAGGGVTSIEFGASLEMDGANARFLAGAGSALAGLAVNAGTLSLQGDVSTGQGGVAQTFSTNFSNFGVFELDNSYGGGSAVTVTGTFLNTAEVEIGNVDLAANTTLNVHALSNQGQMSLQGGVSTTKIAALNVTTNAAAVLTGDWQIGGHASLHFASGPITTIAHGASLELDGASASVTAGAVSALNTLSVNAGALSLNGNGSDGAGGVTFTTTTGLTNSGQIYVDAQNYGGGGDAVTIGGALTNAGEFEVGNTGLAFNDVVSMNALVNQGSLFISGSLGSYSAKVNVASAAAGGIVGQVYLSGNATLAYASGGFTSVQTGSTLSLSGNAKVLAGTSSALTTLVSNYGALSFESSSYYGVAPSLTIGQAFTNFGTFSLDSSYYDGGSAIAVNGLLTNDGALEIGNPAGSPATTLTAVGVANNKEIDIGGMATLTSSGIVANHGQITLTNGGTLDAGANAFTQYAGLTQIDASSQLKAATVNAFGGVIDIGEAVAAGDGLGNFNINGVGQLQFDAGADASHAVTFTQSGGVLALASGPAFNAVIHGFAGTDAIDLLGVSVSSLAFASGALTLQTSGGAETLHFAGTYATGSFTTMSDGAGGTKLLFV